MEKLFLIYLFILIFKIMFNLSIWHWIAIGGGVYLATSYTLFKFPLLLHRKKGKKLRLPPHKPLMMAHRGGIYIYIYIYDSYI